jgi:phosphohistidine phosphatase
MRVWLVHHGDAVGPDVDPQRPLSVRGREAVSRLAGEAAARGARPASIWHSGKLRARETATAFWSACNAAADFRAERGLQPDDDPSIAAERLAHEATDVMLVGHMPHLARLFELLVHDVEKGRRTFPLHGVVALERDSVDSREWREVWRLGP